MNGGSHRYIVVRYADRVGLWYSVTDQWARPDVGIVAAFRSQKRAHRERDARNAQVGSRA